jgi:hypothetical protein
MIRLSFWKRSGGCRAKMLVMGRLMARPEFHGQGRARRLGVLAAAILLLGSVHPVMAEPIEGNTVVLQGLDKVTARVWTFDAPVDATVRFGTLEIRPRFCNRTPPEEPPEVKAFVEILEARDGETRNTLFSGWMFASSPALNALEHPVYDVWVLGCKTMDENQQPAPDQQKTGG